jgi:hypothetical protein
MSAVPYSVVYPLSQQALEWEAISKHIDGQYYLVSLWMFENQKWFVTRRIKSKANKKKIFNVLLKNMNVVI